VRFNVEAGRRYEIAIDGVYGEQGEIILNWNLETSGSRLPEILRQPLDSVVPAGGTATFSILATNPPPAAGPLIYQWYFNGLPLPGETNATLLVPAVNEAKLGLYVATVANATEIVLSDFVVIEIASSSDDIDRRVTTEDKFANLARGTNDLTGLRFSGKGARIIGLGGSVARGYTGSQVFSTVNSTLEAGEPNHCGVVGGASQWFSYLAPANGILTIDTDGSDFDTVISVYTGTEVDFSSLKVVACDNDSGLDGKDSRVSFSAQGGTLYYIVVDGVRGAKGTAHLNYKLAPPPLLRASRAGDQLQIRLTGAERRTFTIQTSANLREWHTVLSTNAPAGTVEWQDSSAVTNTTRFYRAFQAD
jgi:hypothetical protein